MVILKLLKGIAKLVVGTLLMGIAGIVMILSGISICEDVLYFKKKSKKER